MLSSQEEGAMRVLPSEKVYLHHFSAQEGASVHVLALKEGNVGTVWLLKEHQVRAL